jgi:hypothetical protein
MNLGLSVYKLGFQVSPIILTNGIADGIPGKMLPIVAITEAGNFLSGLLQGNLDTNLDNFFAQFRVLPGATLVNNQLGKYPFANQTVAANAIITQPKAVSFHMTCPARGDGGYFSKFITMMALTKVLEKHAQLGGTYTLATPTNIFTNCILLSLRDVSDGSSKQAQTAFQWDFEQPLIALDTAQNAYNTLMAKISGGLPTGGAWTGPAATIGAGVDGLSPIGNVNGLVGVNSSGLV